MISFAKRLLLPGKASKTCASVSRAQPELAEEIVHAITAVKANSETVKVEAGLFRASWDCRTWIYVYIYI